MLKHKFQRITMVGPTAGKHDSGLVLPLVVITFLIIGSALMATTTKSWLNLTGTIRQGQARSARAAAESGITELIASLNSSYAHLLIVDSDKWDDPPLFSGMCSNSIDGIPATEKILGNNQRYFLESYDFEGSPFYGGKALIKMRGQAYKSDLTTIAADAIVEQTVEIKAKSCNTPFNEATQTSGFPGLMAVNIDMGGNDLKGRLSGNLFCTSCKDNISTRCGISSDKSIHDYSLSEKICAIGGNTNQTDIDGEIYLSAIDLPPVPAPPSSMSNLYLNPPDITSTTTIVGGSGSTNLLNGACQVDSDGITHCVVKNINLSGQTNLTIDTSGGNPVRIYVTGDTVDFKGSSGMEHIPATSPASNFGLFGNPIDPTDQNADQNVILRGNANTNNMWVYFPDGNLGIKGGAGDDVNCDTQGECTGGDIHGAVWGKSWGLSNGTGAQITVPADMGQMIFNNYGAAYGIGMKDYAAVGVADWRSFVNINN